MKTKQQIIDELNDKNNFEPWKVGLIIFIIVIVWAAFEYWLRN